MGILAISLSAVFDGVNLAFVLPLVLALVYLGLYIATGVTFGDADGHTADVDTDHHTHTGANHDIVHYDPTKPDGMASTSFNVLSYFGVGKIPASMWLSGLLLGWGAFGLAAAPFLGATRVEPSVAIPMQLIAGLVGSLIVTRGLTVLLTRIIPINETYARRRHELLGSEGEAIYNIDDHFGMAGIRNARGDLFQVGCRAENGEPISKGTRVKLVAYNRDTNLYHVVPAVAQ